MGDGNGLERLSPNGNYEMMQMMIPIGIVATASITASILSSELRSMAGTCRNDVRWSACAGMIHHAEPRRLSAE